MALLPAGDAAVAQDFGGTKYIGLIKSDGNEVSTSSTGYSRQQVADLRQSTESGNENSIVNPTLIDFGTATADWGTIRKVRIFTSSSSSADSTQFYEDTITDSPVNANDTFQIPALGWVITLT